MMRAGSPGQHAGRRAVGGGWGRLGAVGLTQPNGWALPAALPGPALGGGGAAAPPDLGPEKGQTEEPQDRPGPGPPALTARALGFLQTRGLARQPPGPWKGRLRAPLGPGSHSGRCREHVGFLQDSGHPAAPSPRRSSLPGAAHACLVNVPPPEGSEQAAPTSHRLWPQPTGDRWTWEGRRPLPADHPCPSRPSPRPVPHSPVLPRLPCSLLGHQDVVLLGRILLPVGQLRALAVALLDKTRVSRGADAAGTPRAPSPHSP